MGTKTAQVHRFRAWVAVYIGPGETAYMKPDDAAKLARAINRAVKSCRNETFQDSTCGTVQFQFADRG